MSWNETGPNDSGYASAGASRETAVVRPSATLMSKCHGPRRMISSRSWASSIASSRLAAPAQRERVEERLQPSPVPQLPQQQVAVPVEAVQRDVVEIAE